MSIWRKYVQVYDIFFTNVFENYYIFHDRLRSITSYLANIKNSNRNKQRIEFDVINAMHDFLSFKKNKNLIDILGWLILVPIFLYVKRL